MKILFLVLLLIVAGSAAPWVEILFGKQADYSYQPSNYKNQQYRRHGKGGKEKEKQKKRNRKGGMKNEEWGMRIGTQWKTKRNEDKDKKKRQRQK